MQTDYERVWAFVSPDILAQINAVRDSIEQKEWRRPSLGSTVLMLIKQALDARKCAIHDNL